VSEQLARSISCVDNAILQLLQELILDDAGSKAVVKNKIECARLEWQKSKHEGVPYSSQLSNTVPISSRFFASDVPS
jgi:hypothetical protein